MPRWLRLFTFDKLKTWYRRTEDEGESDEAIANLKQTMVKGGFARGQADPTKTQTPTYTVKGPKKP